MQEVGGGKHTHPGQTLFPTGSKFCTMGKQTAVPVELRIMM